MTSFKRSSLFWLAGLFAADEKTDVSTTSWSNIALIGGIVVAIVTAGIALYRASAQRGLDTGTRKKIDEEVKRLQTEHDERRTRRVLRLERYVDENVDYQRRQKQYLNKLTTLLEEAIDAGYVPRHRLPVAPEPPPLPPMPDSGDGD